MSRHIVKELWKLFEQYDRARDEFVRREGVEPDVFPRWPHVDVEGRPE